MEKTISATHLQGLNRVGHALADATRAQILLLLCEGEGQPSVLAEEIGVSRQVMSNQLACLRGCGLVIARREGRKTHYSLAHPGLAQALRELLGLAEVMQARCCTQAVCEC